MFIIKFDPTQNFFSHNPFKGASDALALKADEGRDILRKVSGSCM